MIIGIIVLLIVVGIRFYLSFLEYQKKGRGIQIEKDRIGIAQTMGGMEIQSDYARVVGNEAGVLAVLADGIGKENTGKVSAKLGVETFCSMFSQYKSLNNPAYFLKRGFYAANEKIRKMLGDRRGGASIVAAYMDKNQLSYALAGDAKVAILRNNELIPLSEGHTVDVLAGTAYRHGKITRQEALGALKADRLWNYVGVDEFKNIEIFDTPIQFLKGDIVVLMTKGIFKVLPWVQIEEIVSNRSYSARQKAGHIAKAANRTVTKDRDNGSVIIFETNR